MSDARTQPFERIATGNEMLVFQNDPETKHLCHMSNGNIQRPLKGTEDKYF